MEASHQIDGARPPRGPRRVDAVADLADHRTGRTRPDAARRRRTISAAGTRHARRRTRPARGEGARIAEIDHRRLSADDEMAVEGGRSDRIERAEAHRAAGYAQSPRASPRPADGVSPPARPAGAGHLRA